MTQDHRIIEPSPEEILLLTAEIRSRWDAGEEARRWRGPVRKAWGVPTVACEEIQDYQECSRMARTPIIGGPRDGTTFDCACAGECVCESFGCTLDNNILDGFILWQMYSMVQGAFRQSHVWKQVMIADGCCPRCNRAMPKRTEICLNCGACMGIDFNRE